MGTNAQTWRLQPCLRHRLAAAGNLTVPEFNGNFFFNTLGSFALNPKTVKRS